MKNIFIIIILFSAFVKAQYTGQTPYVSVFGLNQNDQSSGAHWKVTNTDENDIVFVVVNAYSNDVVAHVFISSSETYTFYDLPIATYKYKFSNSGNYYESNKRIQFEGCDPNMYKCSRSYWPYENSLKVWVESTSNSYQSTGKIYKDEFFTN